MTVGLSPSIPASGCRQYLRRPISGIMCGSQDPAGAVDDIGSSPLGRFLACLTARMTAGSIWEAPKGARNGGNPFMKGFPGGGRTWI